MEEALINMYPTWGECAKRDRNYADVVENAFQRRHDQRPEPDTLQQVRIYMTYYTHPISLGILYKRSALWKESPNYHLPTPKTLARTPSY